MKYIILLCISLLGGLSRPEPTETLAVTAETGQTFQNLTLEEAMKKAKKEKKLILLDAYATWCGPCKQMEAKTFSDADVASVLKEKFISIRKDVDKPEGQKIAAKYKVHLLPTLLFLKEDGTVKMISEGFLDKKEFMDLTNEVLGAK